MLIKDVKLILQLNVVGWGMLDERGREKFAPLFAATDHNSGLEIHLYMRWCRAHWDLEFSPDMDPQVLRGWQGGGRDRGGCRGGI